MKVVSPAGDFEISIKEAEIEGNSVIIKGQMGVWDSKIYLNPSDLWLLVSIFLRPSILFFMLQLPFRYFVKRRR